jgi:hypothetical protein
MYRCPTSLFVVIPEDQADCIIGRWKLAVEGQPVASAIWLCYSIAMSPRELRRQQHVTMPERNL